MKVFQRQKTITVNLYSCERCAYETESAYEAEQHESCQHPVQEQRELGTRTFFRFSKVAFMDAYSKEQGWEPGQWAGPGWYGLQRFNLDGDWRDRLISADDILSHVEHLLIEHTELAVGLRELLGRDAP